MKRPDKRWGGVRTVIARTLTHSGGSYTLLALVAMAQDQGARAEVKRVVEDMVRAGALIPAGRSPKGEPLYRLPGRVGCHEEESE